MDLEAIRLRLASSQTSNPLVCFFGHLECAPSFFSRGCAIFDRFSCIVVAIALVRHYRNNIIHLFCQSRFAFSVEESRLFSVIAIASVASRQEGARVFNIAVPGQTRLVAFAQASWRLERTLDRNIKTTKSTTTTNLNSQPSLKFSLHSYHHIFLPLGQNISSLLYPIDQHIEHLPQHSAHDQRSSRSFKSPKVTSAASFFSFRND